MSANSVVVQLREPGYFYFGQCCCRQSRNVANVVVVVDETVSVVDDQYS